VGVYANDNDYGKALQQCESILQAYPNLKGFASCVNTGVTAAGKAVENANLSGKVAIWGTSSPSESREYVKRGTVKGALALDSAQMTYLGILMAYNYITKDKSFLNRETNSDGPENPIPTRLRSFPMSRIRCSRPKTSIRSNSKLQYCRAVGRPASHDRGKKCLQ
jgi:ABC-type sugar transport system substrate-binding protein